MLTSCQQKAGQNRRTNTDNKPHETQEEVQILGNDTNQSKLHAQSKTRLNSGNLRYFTLRVFSVFTFATKEYQYSVSHSLPNPGWLADRCSLSQQLGALQTHSFSFLTQRTYSCSNFVAKSSLVLELSKKCRVR